MQKLLEYITLILFHKYADNNAYNTYKMCFTHASTLGATGSLQCTLYKLWSYQNIQNIIGSPQVTNVYRAYQDSRYLHKIVIINQGLFQISQRNTLN